MIAAVVFADDTPVLRLFAAALAMSAAATQLGSLSVSPATTEFDIEPAIRMIERAAAALVAARPLGIRADSGVEAEVETRVELEMIVADFERMNLVIDLYGDLPSRNWLGWYGFEFEYELYNVRRLSCHCAA
jgi:hypothetical protein